MTTADDEPVSGPSHGNSHVMQMTSQLHLCSSQQLQQTTVCLPVSVQQLTYENGDFHDDYGGNGDTDIDDDGDCGGDVRADDDGPHGDGSDGDTDNDSARADDGGPRRMPDANVCNFN